MLKRRSEFLNDHKKEQLEELAEYVADYHCPRGSINPELIADNLGISYSYGKYEQAYDGLLEHAYGRFHVYINTDRLIHAYTDRARFTFGHELGHYYIDDHRNALAKGLAPSHPSITGFVSENLVEREADHFASCLLLPRNRIITDCFKRRFNFTLLDELSKKYQVSITATAIRFALLGIYPIMVVYSTNNKIKWYTFTHDFPFKILKYGKDKVPEDTAAGEYFQLNRKYAGDEEVFADDWFNVYYEQDSNRKFKEHCVYINTNTVMSVIWE